ncbi:hypothetical protein EFE41_05100 [Methanohalophilus portucalensis FDF-1]|uniref:Uncharacterized protein n=2 Tax=Methanohalophilus portucalensis TaxID=39664 RepID=A0A3M9LEE1_9EURY|nr:hypothetical protein BKM01_03260 [Methanohalophilus portucalensis]RNI11596.1 hypothetical protein EFE41_05100 [Methanohalophilus portucalensis FDF-1]
MSIHNSIFALYNGAKKFIVFYLPKISYKKGPEYKFASYITSVSQKSMINRLQWIFVSTMIMIVNFIQVELS